MKSLNFLQIYTSLQMRYTNGAPLRSEKERKPRTVYVDVPCGQRARERRVSIVRNVLGIADCISCSFFQWAEFDEDGEPPWAKTFNMG